MTQPELEPLDPDVLALLGEAKAIAELDTAAQAKILKAIETRIVPPTGGGPTGSGGARPPSAPSSLIERGAKTLAIFAFGTATGIGIAPLVRPPPPLPVATAPRAEIAPPPSASLSAEPLPVEVAESAPVPPPKRATPPIPSARGLAAERGLLDIARAALARGDADEALASIDRHAREYPNGLLVEEREAMAIKALVALGRREEARRRAKRFEERFPNGLMLRTVKSAIGE